MLPKKKIEKCIESEYIKYAVGSHKIIEIKKLLGGDDTGRWKDDNWGVFFYAKPPFL